tara:strand:- start:62 stop:691 length:630 start_codon:yes stop_codon:yes gene_type:complete
MKKVISKNWLKLHIIISSLLSIIGMIIAANESKYNSYGEEGIITFLCTAFTYWLILLIVVTIIKSFKNNIINRGWLRLHVSLSFLGGIIFSLVYSTLIWDFDETIWGVSIFWPIAYWLGLLLYYGITIFNDNIISKKWLKRHFFINLSISILHMLYRKNEIYEEAAYHGGRYVWEDFEVGFFGMSSFLIYYLLLFLCVWVINGFNKNEA